MRKIVIVDSFMFLANQVRKLVRFIIFALGYTFIIPLTYLVPKADYVVLISRFGNFDGNLKYLFLYFNGLPEKKYNFIFLTDNFELHQELSRNGFQTWLYPSLLTIFRLMQTKIIIVDGNEWASLLRYFFLFRSKKIQVWHAAGLKVIGLLRPSIKNLSRLLQKFKKENTLYDLVVFSSEIQVAKRSGAFRYKKVLINGLPRNDVFFNKKKFRINNLGCDNQLTDKALHFKNNGYKLIIYMPTWRRNHDDLSHINLNSLEKFLQIHKLLYIIKLHPKHKCKIDLKKFNHIYEYDHKADIYPLLAHSHLLITDYSSIYIDYLLTNRPIIFFPYDLKTYLGNERDLLYDYEKVTPGVKCYNSKELEDSIYLHLVEGVDQFVTQRKIIRKEFFKYVDGNSCERLWLSMKDIMQI